MAEPAAYQFKANAHIPPGVTPEGVVAERDRIEHDYGKATIDNSVAAVLDTPEKYPNLRAFCPADETEAMHRAVAEGIRRAYRAVVIYRNDMPKPEPRQVKVIHSVRDADGELVFQRLDVIKRTPPMREDLIMQLRRDADVFAAKMRDTLAEIAEAVSP